MAEAEEEEGLGAMVIHSHGLCMFVGTSVEFESRRREIETRFVKMTSDESFDDES